MRQARHLLARVALGISLGSTPSGVAFAQTMAPFDPTARGQAARHFEDALAAYDSGDFSRAADAFELAYHLVPQVDSLWNAARARQRSNELPRAATLYARYLREAPADARDRGVATLLLGRLAARLGCIEVHGSRIEFLAVDERPSEERIVYVSPGAHVVRAVVAGAPMQQTATLEAGGVVGLVFEAPSPDVSSEQRPPEEPSRLPPKAEASPAPSRSSGAKGLSPWVVAGGAILTGTAVAATIVSGLQTLSALDTFKSSPTEANLQAGRSMQTQTNVLLGVSIGVGVVTTATAIWLVNWRGPAKSDGRIGFGVTRLEAEWRF
jgi:hypothetical protein